MGWRPTAFLLLVLSTAALAANPSARGPLKVHPDNPRYFATPDGRAVLLVGAHTWNNLIDMGPADPPAKFDFPAYLDFLEKHGHNFVRLWTWESASWNTGPNYGKRVHHVAPLPWARVGAGKAMDGKAKFDLGKFDEEYFKRLRTRVASAGERGIYMSIMLFEGWGMQFADGGWESHPLNAKNNVNGVNGDADGDGKGLEVHELVVPAVTAAQEAYVRKVIDTVNDLDNVLYEISNENHSPSTPWQYHMIRFIKEYEKTKPRQHPVGMTFQYKDGSNKTLFDSPADWVSPNPDGGYRDNPPPADGRKVVIPDTDHLWGLGGTPDWVWKSFLRGHNPIFMDPYDDKVLATPSKVKSEPVRQALGQARRLAERMNLAAATPQGKLASSGYCLAAPDREYLVYVPSGGKVTVDLTAAKGSLAAEWLETASGKVAPAGRVEGGARREFASPVKGPAVLFLSSPSKE